VEVAVSHHRALSCSDFPPAPKSQRLSDPLFQFSIYYFLFIILFKTTGDIIAERGLLCAFNFGVFFEILVVGVGEIASEVDAAAFFASEGGLRNEEADGEHILELPALGVIEGLIHNISLPESNLVDGLSHFGGFSGDADVSPHKRPEGVFDVGGIEVPEFGVRDLVFDYRLTEAGGFWGEVCLARDSAEDETFEQRVAAEAVSAVETC